jgi:hypothetical protein
MAVVGSKSGYDARAMGADWVDSIRDPRQASFFGEKSSENEYFFGLFFFRSVTQPLCRKRLRRDYLTGCGPEGPIKSSVVFRMNSLRSATEKGPLPA